MNLALLAVLAASPIILAAILLVAFRWPAKRAMPLVYIASFLIALFVWDMSLINVIASGIQGLFITFDILYIIFGAIFLLNTLKYCFPAIATVGLFAKGGSYASKDDSSNHLLSLFVGIMGSIGIYLL